MMASSAFPEPRARLKPPQRLRERSASASKPISLFKEVVTSNWFKRGRALTSPPAAPAHFQSDAGSSIRPLTTLQDAQGQDDRKSACAVSKRRHPWAIEEPSPPTPTEDTETFHPHVSLTYFSDWVKSEDLLAQEEANERMKDSHRPLGAALDGLTSTTASPTMFQSGCCRREYPSAHWLNEPSPLSKDLDDPTIRNICTYPPTQLPYLNFSSPLSKSYGAPPTQTQAHTQAQDPSSCTLCHCQCIACDWEEEDHCPSLRRDARDCPDLQQKEQKQKRLRVPLRIQEEEEAEEEEEGEKVEYLYVEGRAF